MRFLIVFCMLVSSLAAASAQWPHAEEMFNRAQYQAVIEELKPFTAQPEALRLTGKSFFMLGDFKRAGQYFRKVVSINPLSSVDFQWLGKSWARRADTSNPISAPGYTAQARKSFERAVELDPRSVGSLQELLDTYLERRGLEKAQSIADRIGRIDALEGLRAQQKVLLRRQELRSTEEQVRMAIEQLPREAGRALEVVRPN